MRTSEVYQIKADEIDLFHQRSTPHFHFFKVFGQEKKVSKKVIGLDSPVFIHVIKHDGKIRNIEVLNHVRFEFDFKNLVNLVEYYKRMKMETPKEESNMFSNYKITDVKFGEVIDIALESAIEKIAKDLDGVEIKTRGEKTFLVKDGNAIELQGGEFQKLVESYVKGKTVSSLRNNSAMFSLITKLGIIESVQLSKEKDDLSSIFG